MKTNTDPEINILAKEIVENKKTTDLSELEEQATRVEDVVYLCRNKVESLHSKLMSTDDSPKEEKTNSVIQNAPENRIQQLRVELKNVECSLNGTLVELDALERIIG